MAMDSVRTVGRAGAELGWATIVCEVKVTSLLLESLPASGVSEGLWEVLPLSRASLVQRLNSQGWCDSLDVGSLLFDKGPH